MSHNKYHATKTKCSKGHVHDSTKEVRRCDELHLLQRAKQISGLLVQVRYNLIPPAKYNGMPNERGCDYVADFVYYDGENIIIEDTKGKKTQDYIIKRKLMKKNIVRARELYSEKHDMNKSLI